MFLTFTISSKCLILTQEKKKRMNFELLKHLIINANYTHISFSRVSFTISLKHKIFISFYTAFTYFHTDSDKFFEMANCLCG